jgi:hypothetical protein
MRVVLCLCSMLLAVFVVVSGAAMAADLPAAAQRNASEQIQRIQNWKKGWTKAEQKVGSSLLMAIEQSRKTSFAESLPAFRPRALPRATDKGVGSGVLVDIRATVSDELLAAIADAGGRVINAHARYDAVRAYVPLDAMTGLAARTDVRTIREGEIPYLKKVNTSEGVVAHRADVAVSDLGVDGTGVKIGVLSDSVDHLADVQATGDLPAVTVLKDATGNSGEGTAMLEIVYDMAPGADLYFATAWNGVADFAAQIRALRDAGCQVIVDDVGYFSEAPFQDGPIAQAVDDVASTGVFYFSSAANSGNIDAGTGGVWEGDYSGMAPTGGITVDGADVHNFGGGDCTNLVTYSCSTLTLHWNDPLGESSNDYDLYLVDTSGNVVAQSTDTQAGSSDAFEIIQGSITANNYAAVVVRYDVNAATRMLHLNSNRGRFEYATDGQTHGHACAEGAFGVAAVGAQGRITPFDGSESVESFSSDGPRRMFFRADGTMYVPGDYSSSGGTVRSKPDITAADGVATATPGFEHFYGTSAAAPHAAAIAALMVEADQDITRSEMYSAFQDTALDLGSSGWDRNSGLGLIMADDCVERVRRSGAVAPVNMLLLGD